jgi:hypothetical protein
MSFAIGISSRLLSFCQRKSKSDGWEIERNPFTTRRDDSNRKSRDREDEENKTTRTNSSPQQYIGC